MSLLRPLIAFCTLVALLGSGMVMASAPAHAMAGNVTVSEHCPAMPPHEGHKAPEKAPGFDCMTTCAVVTPATPIVAPRTERLWSPPPMARQAPLAETRLPTGTPPPRLG
ncbi:hypothetical protein [Stakelama tenebrarum]|uniref:DUF2946 domain-containing protein n=1 Tax=Stakelama tenebrarum TaxID=2711215 RepID=A0A6G6Y4H8_9SPHN|nr:hypothetical protein [Sphingosinithalassobacter tenebrarum]QIG79751.1 hypothetical protein G5C33_08060 [Sphingosinithalassobacter tenebrarum]